jgi:hypothetical protein
MKFLLLPTLLASAGLGWLGLARTEADPCAGGCPPGARLELVCADDGSCAIVCFDADGEPLCSRPVECDAPCAAGAPSGEARCTPAPACRDAGR